MKIWWVTAWQNYYPDGGLDNIKGSFSTKEEAEEFAEKLRAEGLSQGIRFYPRYDFVEVENIAHLL